MSIENQPPQPDRPKSQIYLQRAAQSPPSAEGSAARSSTGLTTRRAAGPPTQTNLPAVRPALPALRSSATQRCPNCGAVQPASTSVCMACGAFIQNKAQKKIRCRRCGTQASANLVLCPGCGRELQAAPPRIGLFMASLLLVAVFLILLTRAINFQPMAWMQTQATSSWSWIRTLGDRLDPQITINTIPVTPLAAGSTNNGRLFGVNTANNAAPANGAAVAATTLITNGLTGGTGAGDNPPPVVAENSTISGLVASALVVTPTVVITSAAGGEPLVEVAPTVTTAPTVAPTVAPTPTPNPTATASPPPATATVAPATPTQTSTRPSATATAQAMLVAGNGATGSKAVLLQPTPTFTATATALPTTAPTPTFTPAPPTPTANGRTYTVRAGDTPFAIATQFDLTVIELLSANGLGLEDARRLRVGQTLVIPTVGDEPTATPTVAPSPTPVDTNVPATATATVGANVTPTTAAAAPTAAATVRLDAPRLRSPEPNAFLSCQGENTLTWLPVAFMRESDQYRLHLGFLSGYNADGTEAITWVLEQLMPASVSLWLMDEGLCGLAPQSTGRQWRWYVEVVESTGGALQPVSQSSPIWGFSWN